MYINYNTIIIISCLNIFDKLTSLWSGYSKLVKWNEYMAQVKQSTKTMKMNLHEMKNKMPAAKVLSNLSKDE